MSQEIDAIRKHHQELAQKLSEQVERLVAAEGQPDTTALAAFLRSELAPHATGEEKALYPAVEPLLRAHGQATATMHVDHEFIADYIGQIEAVVESLESARPADRPALLQRLRHLALKLDAIWDMHTTKEERVYLPLLEKYLPEEEQRRLLGHMHAEYSGE